MNNDAYDKEQEERLKTFTKRLFEYNEEEDDSDLVDSKTKSKLKKRIKKNFKNK